MEGCIDKAIQGIGVISQHCGCAGEEEQAIDQESDSPRSGDREFEVRDGNSPQHTFIISEAKSQLYWFRLGPAMKYVDFGESSHHHAENMIDVDAPS